jgi:nucleoid DNA-binding protein
LIRPQARPIVLDDNGDRSSIIVMRLNLDPAACPSERVVEQIARFCHDLPKEVTEAVLGDLVMLAAKELRKGDKIRLTGLGILQVRARPARMGRNPATGESIKNCG